MTKYCDYTGCSNKADFLFFGGLVCLCRYHKNYWNQLRPRLLNLKHNSGRGSNYDDGIFKKFKNL